MGKKCHPIIRNWVGGRDIHNALDLAISEWWLSLSDEEIDQITQFVDANNIHRAYIGVPSPLTEEKAFQLLEKIEEYDDVQNVYTNIG